MSRFPQFEIDDQWVIDHRGAKEVISNQQPYDFLVEQERSALGSVEEVATIFLSNKECPFHCLMCDLWRNTTDERVSIGDIPRQISWALERIPHSVRHIKLYNSGNFFDKQAIPHEDHQDIAGLLTQFDSIIVESHPKLVNSVTLDQSLWPNLQIAMGLETVHPGVLKKLNKKMSLSDFAKAANKLTSMGISSRAFILLKPPFLDEKEGIHWARKSVDFAFDCGVECCVIIPTRPGNGALDRLSPVYFSPPNLQSLEDVLEYGISLGKGRVFADLWDVQRFSQCQNCLDLRVQRMHQMNLTQQYIPGVECSCV